MNHVLNIFSIFFNINLSEFEQFGFSSPSVGGAIFGEDDRVSSFFRLQLMWQSLGTIHIRWGVIEKLRGQPLVHSQKLGSLVWVPSLLFFLLGLNKGYSPLPYAGVSCSHGLSCVRMLSWVFIPHGLLLVNIFFLGFFINTCNGPFLLW